MTNVIDMFTLRTTKKISLNSENYIEELSDLNLEEIPTIVCSFEENSRITNMDFGSWCYTNTKRGKDSGIYVLESSLKLNRVKGVKFLIEEYCNIRKSFKTTNSYYKETNVIFNYINKRFPNSDCSNLKDAKEIYISFTKYLLNAIQIKKNSSGFVNTDHQVAQQEILAKFLAACTDTTEERFHTIIRKIGYTRGVKPLSSEEAINDINTKIKILLEIFNTLYDHLINEKDLPCIIDLKKYGLNRAYIDLNFINKSQNDFLEKFYDNQKIRSLEEFNKKLNDEMQNTKEDQTKKRFYRKKYHYKINKLKVLNSLNFKDCNPKVLMANFLIMTFAKLLISTSGANESVIYKLKTNQFETISTEKGKRAITTKQRASNKKVPIEFGLKFKSVFNKYKILREKINDIYRDEIQDEKKKLLFIKLPVKNIQSNSKIMEIDSVSFDKYHELYRRLFNTQTVLNKELRNNVSNIFFNATNSAVTTSIKLGNTPEIASRVYMNASFNELASQLSNYFVKLDESIILKGRKHSKVIPIKIDMIGEVKVHTPIGNCSQDSPKLIEDFNYEIPSPTCNKLNSCLFCNSYVLRLNKEDIKKIL